MHAKAELAVRTGVAPQRSVPGEGGEDDELALFAGQTRVRRAPGAPSLQTTALTPGPPVSVPPAMQALVHPQPGLRRQPELVYVYGRGLVPASSMEALQVRSQLTMLHALVYV